MYNLFMNKIDNINKNESNKKYRVIFHIDMNCFFASCHIAENPSLAGLPLVVAHNDAARKSIILTASYEARKYGIYTTMLTRDAIKLCPRVKIVEPNYGLYEKYSKEFFKYLFSITKLVEAMSIDEGFLDVTDVVKPEDIMNLAKTIQNTLFYKYHLPCSIGIAPNKFLAKMGSDLKKPMGISVVRKKDLAKTIWPLDIKDMFGVGKKTEPKLREIGINKIGDIITFKDRELLEKTVGPAFTNYLIEKANGNDDSKVTLNNYDDFQSVSNEHTFDYNVNSIDTIKTMIKILSNSIGDRLRRHEFVASTIGVKIKYSDFTLITRSKAVNTPTDDDYVINRVACSVFDDNFDYTKTVRLIGVFVNRLSSVHELKNKPKQLSLFDDIDEFDKEERQIKVNKLLDNINKNLGSNIINVGIDNVKNKR